MWNLSWVCPASVEMAFVQWSFPSRSKFFKKVWSVIFLVIMWSIWKERNVRAFMNKSSSTSEVCNLILLRLGWWIKGWKEPFPYSLEEVARTPSCLRWNEVSIEGKTSLSILQPQVGESNGHPKLSWRIGVSINSHNSSYVTGVILNSSQGRCICAFSCPIPFMDFNAASTLAIHKAIQITINNSKFNIHPMIIESDSMEVVNWSLNQSGGPDNMHFIF